MGLPGIEFDFVVPIGEQLRQEQVWRNAFGHTPDHTANKKGYIGGWKFDPDCFFGGPLSFLQGDQITWKSLQDRYDLIAKATQAPFPDIAATNPFQAALGILEFVKSNIVAKESDPAYIHDMAVLNRAAVDVINKARAIQKFMIFSLKGQQESYHPGVAVTNLTHEDGNYGQRKTIQGYALSPESLVLLLRGSGIIVTTVTDLTEIQTTLQRRYRHGGFFEKSVLEKERDQGLYLEQTYVPGLKLGLARIHLGTLTGRDIDWYTGGPGPVKWSYQHRIEFWFDKTELADLLLSRLAENTEPNLPRLAA